MAESVGVAMEVGTGKGKGKGKPPMAQPPGPSGQAKSKAKAKSKAQGGFLPNMRKPAKIQWYSAFDMISLQAEDGHFETVAIADRLQQLASGIPDLCDTDFKAELLKLGDEAATMMVVKLIDKLCDMVKTTGSGIELQTIGDGRGNSQKVKEMPKTTDEERLERAESMKHTFGEKFQAACGQEWYACAQRWLSAHGDSAGLNEGLDALMDAWFEAFGVRGVVRGVSEEERKRKEEEQRVKNDRLREEEARRAAHWKTLASRSVEDVPWDLVKTVMWCSGGMGGALLVQIGDSEAVVVKPQGMSAVAEAIAVEVASLVGVHVAKNRVLSLAHDEFFTMSAALHAAPKMVDEHQHQVELISSGSKEFVALLEYVPGVVLQGSEAQVALRGDDVGTILEGLGKIIALDCLLNNVDRVPAIWHNDGNLSNVMIVAGFNVVGIDQQVNAISDVGGRDRYFAALREFCGDVQQGRITAPSVARIRTAIMENCGVELTDCQCERILIGVRQTFALVANDSVAIAAALPAVDAKLTRTFGHASVDVGLSRLEHMLEFVGACVEVVAQTMS
mmetsp:Transcript_130362/g.325215  ORF Transcript_130362/g.325215 Transcript_130362/m.325215 type:complete len:562 (+) Transcript_130362:56-1741(+)